MIINGHWYTQNASRPYPIDDSASALDDSGTPLPSDIIVDLQLQFPEAAGKFAFLSAVTVTPNIVTVTLLACRAPLVESNCSPAVGNSGLSFVPLASLSAAKPVDPGRPYLLESLYPGAGGAIVFGPGIDQGDEVFSARFSTPDQSLLAPRAARWYEAPPVTGVRKLAQNTNLTGIVQLRGGTDIEVVGETRDIRGTLFNAIVVRLRDKTDDNERNVFDLYKGPCGARPESDTCGDPAPIEYINTVQPDCCGNITLEFFGCGDIMQLTGDSCGAVIDCETSVLDACVKTDVLPTAEGVLPNEYDNECGEYSEVSEYVISLPPEGEVPEYEAPVENTEPDLLLPYIETFDDSSASDFIVKRGGFGFTASDSPQETEDLGSELVSNGDFSAGVNISGYGWTTTNHDGDIDTGNDYVVVPYDQDGGGGASAIELDVTVTAPTKYRVQYQLKSVAGDMVVEVEDGGGTLFTDTHTSDGLFETEVVATTTTLTLRITADDPGDTAAVDLISVREVIPTSETSESYAPIFSSIPLSRAVACWQPSHPGWTTFYKTCEVHALMPQSSFGVKHNAAVVANLRDSTTNAGRNEYWVAEIDWDGQFLGTKSFRLAHFDGLEWSTLRFASVPNLQRDVWYQLRISVLPVTGEPNAAWLFGSLSSVNGTAISESLGPVYVADWAVDDGLMGLATNEAETEFSYFRVDNQPEAP